MSLVLLPGLLCDAALWEPQITALGDREEGDVADFFVADLTTQSSMQEMASSVLRDAPFERVAFQ